MPETGKSTLWQSVNTCRKGAVSISINRRIRVDRLVRVQHPDADSSS